MPYKNPPVLFHVWNDMLGRCRNPNNLQYKDYGGRGIRVCERWLNYKNFEADMGSRPSRMTLDRINNDGNYEPGNCRWATRKEQQRNRRNAVFVTIEGQQHRAIELSELYGLKTDTIVDRASKGMSFAEVVQSKRHVYTAGLALGGKASGAKQQAKTHCPYGHEFSPENTRVTKEGWRRCMECGREKTRRYLAAKRARVTASGGN